MRLLVSLLLLGGFLFAQIASYPPSASGSATGNGVQPIAAYAGTCLAGSLYFDGAQSPNQQLYTCSAVNTLTQSMALYDSTLLLSPQGQLYVNTGLIPALANTQAFTGLQKFDQAVALKPSLPLPVPAVPSGYAALLYISTDNKLHFKLADGTDHVVTSN